MPPAFNKRVRLLWVGAGTGEDGASTTRHHSCTTSLDAAGIKHVVFESPGTAHEWQTWRRSLNDFAPRLFGKPGRFGEFEV